MKNKFNLLLVGLILLSFLIARMSGLIAGQASQDGAEEAPVQEEVEDPEDAEALGEASAEDGNEGTVDSGDGEEETDDDESPAVDTELEVDSDLAEEELEILEEMEEDLETASDSGGEDELRMLQERLAARRAYRELLAGIRTVTCAETCLYMPGRLNTGIFSEKKQWTIRELAGLTGFLAGGAGADAYRDTGAEGKGFVKTGYFFVRSGVDKMPHLAFRFEGLSRETLEKYTILALIHYDHQSGDLHCSFLSDVYGNQELTANSKGLIAKSWTDGGALAYDRFYSYYYLDRDGGVSHFYSAGCGDRSGELSGRGADDGRDLLFYEYFLEEEDPAQDPEHQVHTDLRTLHTERSDRAGMDNTLSYEPSYLYSDSFSLYASYDGQASHVVDNTAVLQKIIARAGELGLDMSVTTNKEPESRLYTRALAAMIRLRYSIAFYPPEVFR